MAALQGTKALEAWCRQVTANYDGVNILNMTTSWRNGLGFCAIIHHHCPHLIEFDSLDPDDVFGNNELAFTVAEQHLGIPSLLDPQDMVECELLDRLSILTYLSQYFQAFNNQAVQTRVRRLGSMSKSSSANSELSEGGRRQVPTIGKLSDPCRVCSKSVFILERLNVAGRILHRTCFKCARCGTQLSLAGYYETETGEYCCELCPDEEHREEKRSTLQAGMRLPSDGEDEEADSGHSSEKDIEDEGQDTEDQHPKFETEVVTVEEITSIETKLDEASNPCSDMNANIESPLTCIAEIPVNNKSSNICSEIDVNDNSVDEVQNNPVNTVEEEVAPLEVSTDLEVVNVDYPDDKNPFGEEEEEKLESNADNASEYKHTERVSEKDTGIQLSIPSVSKPSLNPFGSDIESENEEEEKSPTTLTGQNDTPKSVGRKQTLNPFGSGFSSDEDHSVGSSSPSPSVRSGTRTRKKRRAPLPPGSLPATPGATLSSRLPIPSPRYSLNTTSRCSAASVAPSTTAETAKKIKDENNMNRRSQILESIKNESSGQRPELQSITNDVNSQTHQSDMSNSETASFTQSDSLSLMSASTTTQSSGPSASGTSQIFSPLSPDKAEEGQWRKKKGPAPPRPIPPKRSVKKLHRKAINQELQDIEVKQGELERQGVKLEKTIREICDKNDEEGENRDSLGPEAEDLIIQLFDLVNEKNELFRRQTELIYMKKDNRLEEQHADLEYQIRILMSKPEGQKTEEEEEKEDRLIKKLVEVVGLRNEIVDCLEMDRLRERDEDTAIEDHMSSYAAVQPEESSKKGISKILRMKKKKKKDKDNEKDIDTSEQPESEEQSTNVKKNKKSAKKKILRYASKKLTFPH